MVTPSESAQKVLAALPQDGSMVTNAVAMQQSHLDYDAYTLAKKELRDRGTIAVGKGRGGRIGLTKAAPKESQGQGVSLEKELYEHVERHFKERWNLDHDLPHRVFTSISANRKGPKKKGLWTVPDVASLGIAKYEFLPSTVIEVTTVEVKTAKNVDPSGVFEAASHNKYAHKSYLVYERLQGVDPAIVELQRLKDEARRFGVGLIEMVRTSDGGHWVFQELLEAVYQEPEPGLCNAFIDETFKAERKEILAAI